MGQGGQSVGEGGGRQWGKAGQAVRGRGGEGGAEGFAPTEGAGKVRRGTERGRDGGGARTEGKEAGEVG